MSELPENNLGEARRWLSNATEELAAAERLSADPETPPRISCFLSHLAAEKAMKAWLIFLGVPFRKVHDLAELLALLPAEAARQIDVDDLILLNPWTILGRYPDDVSEATAQEGEASAAAAGRILDAVSSAVAG